MTARLLFGSGFALGVVFSVIAVGPILVLAPAHPIVVARRKRAPAKRRDENNWRRALWA